MMDSKSQLLPCVHILCSTQFQIYVLIRSSEPHGSESLNQKIVVLKSKSSIQGVALVSLPTVQVIFIASGKSLFKVSLSDEEESEIVSRPNKVRKVDSFHHQDIFADLLSNEDEEQNDKFQREESTMSGVFFIDIEEKHRLHSFYSEVVEIAVHEKMLIALLDDWGLARLEVFNLGDSSLNTSFTLTHSFPTSIDVTLFGSGEKCDSSTSNTARRMYIAMRSETVDLVTHDILSGDTQTIALPQKLFTLLFGKEAACLKTPVILLCDVKGRVHFQTITSHICKGRGLSLLCDSVNEIVHISRLELAGSITTAASHTNEAIITSLEAALASPGRDSTPGKEQTKHSQGFLIVNKAGDCILFLPDEKVENSVVRFSLPEPAHSVLVRRSAIFYTTATRVEQCCVVPSGSENNHVSMKIKSRTVVSSERPVSLFGFTGGLAQDGNNLLAVTDNFELLCLPVPENVWDIPEEAASTRQQDKSVKSITEDTLSRVKDLKQVQSHVNQIDNFLLQLNLLASLIKQNTARAEYSQPLDEGGRVVSCECRILSTPRGYNRDLFLHVEVKNNTRSSFSSSWKVCIALQKSNKSVDDCSSYFTLPFSQGLAQNSTLSVSIPITSLFSSQWDLCVSVSLMLDLDYSFHSKKDMSSHLSKSLFVDIHRQNIDCLDCSHIATATDVGLCYHGKNLMDKTRHLAAIGSKHKPRMSEEIMESKATTQTYTMSVACAEKMCAHYKFHQPVDVVRFLLTRSLGPTSGYACETSQVYLQTPTGQITSLSVAADSSPSMVSECEERKFKFCVTIRGAEFEILHAMREAVRRKLEMPYEPDDGKDQPVFPSPQEMYSKLHQSKRLAEELDTLRSRLQASDFDPDTRHRDTNNLCELFDRFEVIK